MSNPTNMEDFIKAVKEDLTERLSDLYPGIQVEQTYVEKAQGESYEGIRLQIPGQVAAPVMNVEPFYEKVTTSVPYREVIEDMRSLPRSAGMATTKTGGSFPVARLKARSCLRMRLHAKFAKN